jgi:hypothetical protein
MDVSGLSGVLTTHETRTKLAIGNKQVQVIGPNEVLSHASNRGIQRSLTVVIGSVFGNVTC